jgi:hypothetical protein
MVEYKLGKLNEQGISKFSLYLDELKTNPTISPPYELLSTSGQFADKIALPSGGEISVDIEKKINTRKDIANLLVTLIDDEDLNLIVDDKGIGAWFGLAFFNSICPKKDGLWEPGHNYRFIPNLEGRKQFFRHQVIGPLVIHYHITKNLELKEDRSMLYLVQESCIHPDTAEQVASREDIMLCKSLVEVIHRLYWDPKINNVKINAQSEDKDGAIRRFVGPGGFYRKYSTTWDFFSMSADEVWAKLPVEFDEFKNQYESTPF